MNSAGRGLVATLSCCWQIFGSQDDTPGLSDGAVLLIILLVTVCSNTKTTNAVIAITENDRALNDLRTVISINTVNITIMPI